MLDYSRYRSKSPKSAPASREFPAEVSFIARNKVCRTGHALFHTFNHPPIMPNKARSRKMQQIYDPSQSNFSSATPPTRELYALCSWNAVRHKPSSSNPVMCVGWIPTYDGYKLMKMIFMATGVGCFCLWIKSTPARTLKYRSHKCWGLWAGVNINKKTALNKWNIHNSLMRDEESFCSTSFGSNPRHRWPGLPYVWTRILVWEQDSS